MPSLPTVNIAASLKSKFATSGFLVFQFATLYYIWHYTMIKSDRFAIWYVNFTLQCGIISHIRVAQLLAIMVKVRQAQITSVLDN